jgi:DNA-binding MarR family transcriptional regulator
MTYYIKGFIFVHSKFGFLSYEISHIIRQRFNKAAEPLGFTHAQWRALVHLSENQNCRQIDLAEILEIKPITLVKQIDLLEESGMVVRNKDIDDRRAYRLSITDKALTVMEALWTIADAVEVEVLAALSEEERRLMTSLLGRVKTSLSTDSN